MGPALNRLFWGVSAPGRAAGGSAEWPPESTDDVGVPFAGTSAADVPANGPVG